MTTRAWASLLAVGASSALLALDAPVGAAPKPAAAPKLSAAPEKILAANAKDPVRELRMSRIEKGLADQQQTIKWIQALPERWTTGYSRVEKQLLIDAVADCVTTTRVGARGDGGKWLCNPYRIQAGCVVYGVGAGPEISFEEKMAEEFGCEVHVFDPSKESVKNYGRYAKTTRVGKGTLTYHPWALGPVSEDPANSMKLVMDGAPAQVKTLDAITKLLGHTKVDLLKIDIEGGEFGVLPYVLKKSLLKELKVKQLELEMHAFDVKTFAKLASLIGALSDASYLLFRKEINPYAPETCGEYAFAERTYLLD